MLAVLRTGAFTISMSANVTVVGSRPLVIVADGPVQLDGTLDVAADHANAGPGGATSTNGPGAGGNGQHRGTYGDSGGGGAGYGQGGGGKKTAEAEVHAGILWARAPGKVVASVPGER